MTRPSRLSLTPLLIAVLLTACGDRPTPVAPGEIVAAISDGAHEGGNPDFFFLPPLVGNPSSDPNFDPGKFNGRLHPVMRINRLSDGCGVDGITPVYGPVVVPAVPSEEMYKLNWDTDGLTAGQQYTLCVYSSASGKVPLGFVDLAPVTGGVKNLRTNDVATFQQGRVLPVKFRIEHGALSFDPEHPDANQLGTEFTVGPAGGFATLESETTDEVLAAVAVPPGAVPQGEEVTIIIAQEEPQFFDPETNAPQCLPGSLVQSDWCYQLRTEPELYDFAQDVRVEICVDVARIPGLADQLLVHKYNQTQGLLALPWADPTLVGSDCSGPSPLGAAAPPGQGILARLGQWARRLLAPPDLMASVVAGVPKGLGGLGGSFSDFGGAMPLLSPGQDEYIYQYRDAPFCDSQYGFRIPFDWTDVAGAVVGYELYAIGANATIPLINNLSVEGSSYEYDGCGSYVIPENAAGWTWHVTAIFSDETRVQSPTGRFNFTEPFQLTRDQYNDGTTGTSYGCGITPSGNLIQSFTPSASSLAAIDLRLRAGGSFPEAGYVASIRVRSGTPGGDIIATSSTEVSGLTTGEQVVVRFSISPERALVPGSLYFIEWVSPPAGDGVLTWMGTDENPYPGGANYDCSGTQVPARDMVFATWW